MAKQAYFWDSNVFYRLLSGVPQDYVEDINKFAREAQSGEIDILCSTLVLAEVRPSHIMKSGIASQSEFYEDVKGVFKLIEPNPDIMLTSGVLKDWKYNHATKAPRDIGTPDAIQLSTCLYARDKLNYKSIIFHTFDDGKSKTMGEKSVSLLNFQDWLVGCSGHTQQQIALIPRQLPAHPTPGFNF